MYEHDVNNSLIYSGRLEVKNIVTERLRREVVQKATISQQVWGLKLACLWICLPHVMPVATHAEQKAGPVETYYLQTAFLFILFFFYHQYKFQKAEKKCIFCL